MTDFRLHLSHTVSLIDTETRETIWAGSIEQFFADNEFDADEVEAIHAELSVNGFYRGGGGAEATWELRDCLLPKPAPGSAKLAA